MGHIPFIVVRRPHYEQRYAIEHPDALVTFFTVGLTRVLSGEQVTVEESL